ncbi:hypothetical protein FRC19_003386 [Serendipita sp. 401]|nr:hypothetical protein FRC15_003103 [Serendipita sp. 397]KAG8812087.1 hypothetical protein FRC19_003386 [Serendipita sp. 401]KAG9042835.1 hypothetical protein FS842_002056 [Serendipita sp. 407]
MNLELKSFSNNTQTRSHSLNIQVARPTGTAQVNLSISNDNIDPSLLLTTIEEPSDWAAKHNGQQNQHLGGRGVQESKHPTYDLNTNTSHGSSTYHIQPDAANCTAYPQHNLQSTLSHSSVPILSASFPNSFVNISGDATAQGTIFHDTQLQNHDDWVVLPPALPSTGGPGVEFSWSQRVFPTTKDVEESGPLTAHHPSITGIRKHLQSESFLWNVVLAVLSSQWYRSGTDEEALSAQFQPREPTRASRKSPFGVFLGPEYQCLLCDDPLTRSLDRALGHVRGEHFKYRPYDGAPCQNGQKDAARRRKTNKGRTCSLCNCSSTVQNWARHIKTPKHKKAAKAAAERVAANSAETVGVPADNNLVIG